MTAEGYVVFDESFEAVPDLKGGPDEKPWWGGYEVSFKLIEREKYHFFKNSPKKMRDQALALGTGSKRTFKIDLSKCEYTKGKAEGEIGHFAIYVYTPEMIAVEKLRAICQQMPEYPHTGNKKARARDFYDIYHVVTSRNIDLGTEADQNLARHIFETKQVPLSFLNNMLRVREFHRVDWQSVINATVGELHPFDFYFDFVIGETERLKSLWVE